MALQAMAETTGGSTSTGRPHFTGKLKMSRDLSAPLKNNVVLAPRGDSSPPPLWLKLSTNLATVPGASKSTAVAKGKQEVTAPIPVSQSLTPSVAPHGASDTQIVLGGVRINGMRVTEATVLMRDSEGRFYARQEDVEGWGLKPPPAPLQLGAEQYYALNDMPGLDYSFDDPSQELLIQANSRAFPGTSLQAIASGAQSLSQASPGGFLNYDFSATHVVAAPTQVDGLLEAGLFNSWGAATGNVLLRNLAENGSAVRLDTSFIKDFPDKLASLRIGDAISQPGTIGGAVRFGGLQWATNFATRPGYITFPQPAVRGEATLPSVVDVYVNDSLRLSQNLPPGPFEIMNVPVVTGDGQIRLVQRDLLGRQQILVLPYYATSQLLKEGLHAYSYEAGFIRENFGISSADYGRAVAVGTHRYGFTDQFTGEYHAELLADQQMAGVAGSWLFPKLGTFDLGAGGSHSELGNGGRVNASWERQLSLFSVGARAERATENFFKLGDGVFRTRALNSAFVGFSPGYGSLSFNYTDQKRIDGEAKIMSVNYAVPLARSLSMNLLGVHSRNTTTNDDLVSVTFTLALDPRTTAVVNASHEAGQDAQLIQVQQALPTDRGVAFRMLAGSGSVDRVEGGVSAQNGVGLYTLEASRVGTLEQYRAQATGGIAVLDSSPFLSRRIDDSFALVKVPGFANLGIYRNNRLVAHTNDEGVALLTGLLPYESNPISIEVTELPIDVQSDLLQKDAVPRFRSGTVMEFSVKPSAGALLVLVQEDGKPIPAGAIVSMQGGDMEFPIAERGEVYVTGLTGPKHLQAAWADKTCGVDIVPPKSLSTLPRIGPLTCK